MRKLSLLAVAGLLAVGLVAPAVPATASSSPTSVTSVSVAAAAKPCKAHKPKKKNYWVCVTPGSYCPKAARKKYGYAYKTNKRYRCSEYSNGQWRWKRA